MNPRDENGSWVEEFSFLGKIASIQQMSEGYAAWIHPSGIVYYAEVLQGLPVFCPSPGWWFAAPGEEPVNIDPDSLIPRGKSITRIESERFDSLDPSKMEAFDATQYLMIAKEKKVCGCPNKYSRLQIRLLEKYGTVEERR